MNEQGSDLGFFGSAGNTLVREYRRKLVALDPWMGEHSDRVAVYAVATAEGLGWTGLRLRKMAVAAALHDVGKTSLEQEYRHGLNQDAHASQRQKELDGFDPEIAGWVRGHHSRRDGEEVSIASQIIGVAESHDMAAHGSPWAEPRPWDIREELVTRFDAGVVEALLRAVPKIHPILKST